MVITVVFELLLLLLLQPLPQLPNTTSHTCLMCALHCNHLKSFAKTWDWAMPLTSSFPKPPLTHSKAALPMDSSERRDILEIDWEIVCMKVVLVWPRHRKRSGKVWKNGISGFEKSMKVQVIMVVVVMGEETTITATTTAVAIIIGKQVETRLLLRVAQLLPRRR